MCFGVADKADNETALSDKIGFALTLPETPKATTVIAPAIAVPAIIDVIRFLIEFSFHHARGVPRAQ
jgi:hypothetical protein